MSKSSRQRTARKVIDAGDDLPQSLRHLGPREMNANDAALMLRAHCGIAIEARDIDKFGVKGRKDALSGQTLYNTHDMLRAALQGMTPRERDNLNDENDPDLAKLCKRANKAALPILARICGRLFPAGHVSFGRWFVGTSRFDKAGTPPGALRINLRTGCWQDSRAERAGRDVVSLCQHMSGQPRATAARRLIATVDAVTSRASPAMAHAQHAGMDSGSIYKLAR